jgi:hypothetical protein
MTDRLQEVLAQNAKLCDELEEELRRPEVSYVAAMNLVDEQLIPCCRELEKAAGNTPDEASTWQFERAMDLIGQAALRHPVTAPQGSN